MFVYRNFVSPLAAAGYRVIVPDHLGFGRSDEPHDGSLYTVSRHIERFDALLESLDLHGATVVPHSARLLWRSGRGLWPFVRLPVWSGSLRQWRNNHQRAEGGKQVTPAARRMEDHIYARN